MREWIKSVNENADSLKMILVGNKIDLDDAREISLDEGRIFSNLYDIPFYETSVKDNKNVDEAFEKLVSSCIEKIKKETPREEVKLTSTTRHCGCCI